MVQRMYSVYLPHAFMCILYIVCVCVYVNAYMSSVCIEVNASMSGTLMRREINSVSVKRACHTIGT